MDFDPDAIMAERMRQRQVDAGLVDGEPTTTASSTDPIAAFILDRLDEDEAVARGATRSPWSYGTVESVAGGSLYDADLMIASLLWDSEPADTRIRRNRTSDEADANGAHIARHDPARVFADIEAKRQIVAAVDELARNPARLTDPYLHATYTQLRRLVLAPLARVWRDHPDYVHL